MSKKFKPAKNRNWRKRWLDTIKYDQDWDFGYFFDIIIKKLELTKETLEKTDYLADEEKEEMLEQINEVLTIGYRIKEDDYTKSIDFMDGNSTWEVTFERITDNKDAIETLFKVTQTGENSDSDKIFDENSTFLDGFNELDKLAKDLKIPEEARLYGSKTVWKSETAEEEFRRLLEQDKKDKDNDFEAFWDLFKKNFRNWWW